MGLFDKATRPPVCKVCLMRDLHDMNLHRIHARRLAKIVKELRVRFHDKEFARQEPTEHWRCEGELAANWVLLREQAELLSIDLESLEVMIATA
jgi:hypothetical protein